MKKLITGCLGIGLAGLCGLLTAGCEIDSAETAIREVGVIVEGFYDAAGKNGGNVVSENSGAPITTLNLRQTGDQLEGVDNNGIIFKGTIGNVEGESTFTASFTLRGQTTAGEDGVMAGVFDVSGSSSIMKGTWAEPNFFGTVYGEASVPQTPTNSTANLTITASGSTTLNTNGDTVSLSASGGSGGYTWTVPSSAGSVSPSSGSTVTYTRNAAGNTTVTVTDSSSDTESITITQP